MKNRNKADNINMARNRDKDFYESQLIVTFINGVKSFFRKRVVWPLTFLIMILLLFSFISLFLFLDTWLSNSSVTKSNNMLNYVELLRSGHKK